MEAEHRRKAAGNPLPDPGTSVEFRPGPKEKFAGAASKKVLLSYVVLGLFMGHWPKCHFCHRRMCQSYKADACMHGGAIGIHVDGLDHGLGPGFARGTGNLKLPLKLLHIMHA